MSIKVAHECDRCGHTVTSAGSNTLARWGTLHQVGGSSSGNDVAPPVSWLLCPECIDECAVAIVREAHSIH